MRTTIRLDEKLLTEAKELAARTGQTLTAVIEGALRETLARARRRSLNDRQTKLPTFKGGGLQAGVDLDDSAALLHLMESARDPD